jgi:hypothetical protein
MTTNCDLDEVRHIAQQKFLELVESGVEWKYELCGLWFGYRAGGFEVSSIVSCLSGGYEVKLAREVIWRRWRPAPRYARKNKNGSTNKADEKKAQNEWLLAQEDFDKDPMVVACKKVICEHQKRQMEDALKTSCKALQEALKDPATTLPPPTYTEHIEPCSAFTGHSGRRYPWWQFWRGL